MKRKTLAFGFFILLSMGLVISPLFSQSALGQKFPSRPIEIVVSYGPGGDQDLLARLVAEIAPKYLGQPISVINKPGAGGAVAAAEVISSKPDGYKLITLTNTFFSITTKTQKIPFDPADLTPLSSFMQYREGICVRGDSPWKTFNDLLDYARKNPGKLKWANSGRGIAPHIAVLSIFKKAGVETIDVPYKGGNAEKIPALLGGHVDAAQMSFIGPVVDFVKAGKIRYLASISERRYADLPGVPTIAELGFPESAKLNVLATLCIHKDTPEEIKKILIDTFKKTYDDPEFKKGLDKIGAEPRFGGPEFVNESIKRGEEVSVPVLKDLGLYVGK